MNMVFPWLASPLLRGTALYTLSIVHVVRYASGARIRGRLEQKCPEWVRPLLDLHTNILVDGQAYSGMVTM
jgi:hypothetical protein